MRHRIRQAHFVNRLRLPTTSESCLTYAEISALQDFVAGDSDALRRAPGFTRLAAAYLWLLAWNERHREAVAVVLAGREVH
jgi:DNA-directed RNA polymerase alpha subunit